MFLCFLSYFCSKTYIVVARLSGVVPTSNDSISNMQTYNITTVSSENRQHRITVYEYMYHRHANVMSCIVYNVGGFSGPFFFRFVKLFSFACGT